MLYSTINYSPISSGYRDKKNSFKYKIEFYLFVLRIISYKIVINI